MEHVKSSLERVVLDPRYADYLAILKAARNGAVYGAKVRFPHALVMVFLFRSGTFRSKLALILKATRQHARNLAIFATLYKASALALRYGRPDGKEAKYDTFLAGLIGGYAVFGRGMQSSVNQQIVVYVFARVVLALAKLCLDHHPQSISSHNIRHYSWPVFASLSWAGVMWLFRWHPETLQPSLRSSMTYIYANADRWDSLRNFFIHNQ